MVAPHPTLLRKLRNTSNIVAVNKAVFVPELHSRYPQDYTSLDVHKVITENLPWREWPSPLRLEPFELLESLQPAPMLVDKILVLCIDFKDKPATLPTSTIYNRLFGTYSNSLKNYYKEISHSRYVPNGQLYGWYRAPQNSTYYTDKQNGFGKYPKSVEKLIEDVVNIASKDHSINWPSFDINNNGYIDNLIVVHSGAEAAYTGNLDDFWAHIYIIPQPKVIQGKTVWIYAITSEYINKPTDPQAIGGDVHEHGHQLGLPDLYDTTYKTNGVGAYSLMGAGSWANKGITPIHLDAWSKYVLGFADAKENPTGTSHLNDAESHPDIIKYTTADPKEYYLVENRQKILYDKYLPSQGIFVWHINENKADNTDPTCYLVGLVQADGLKDLENARNEGDLSDPFPGTSNNRSYGVHTTPNSVLCNKTVKSMSISKISDSGRTMTFYSSPR